MIPFSQGLPPALVVLQTFVNSRQSLYQSADIAILVETRHGLNVYDCYKTSMRRRRLRQCLFFVLSF